jgi:hypothetical protein
MSYSEQLAVLQNSKRFASSAHVCGKNEKDISGFKPLSFDQDQNTYRALDDMGMKYDAGFKAGILYAPGHEEDVWPYPVEGHNFYAVPISSCMISGEKVPLQDSYFKENGLAADRWYDALTSRFNETSGKNEPLVISLTTSISGSGDYLSAFKKFIEYTKSENAYFVNTTQLVDMSVGEGGAVSTIPAKSIASSECTTCNQNKENQSTSNATSNETITISVDMYNTT